MMGIHEPQKELFSYAVDLDKRVRADNPLRKVKSMIDFTWIRQEVKHSYGNNGHVSVDPVLIVKLMFILFWDNIRSERELMRIVGERLDYLWFLDLGLDDPVAGHSVLSKTRSRWGKDLFEKLFVQTVRQCVEEGLVGGKVLHIDGSLVVADASKDSIIKGPVELIGALKEAYGVQEKKLGSPLGNPYYEPENAKLMSTTDPDAAVVSRNTPGAKGDPHPCYKHHRVVDDREGVITAIETTPGDVQENHKLEELVDQHESNSGLRARTLVADSQYGTVGNFRKLYGRGFNTHMSILHGKGRGDRAQYYPLSAFEYDPGLNRYRCPQGPWLRPRRYDPRRKGTEFHTRKGVCAACPMRSECTRSKTGRTVFHHDFQQIIDAAHQQAGSHEARLNRLRRKWRVEGSFGQATRHHFKRARYRRLWRQQIQDYLIVQWFKM